MEVTACWEGASLKILFLSFYYPPHVGASGRIVQEMVNSLRRNNLVTLLTMNLPVKLLRADEPETTQAQKIPRFPLPAAAAAILVLPLFVYWSIRKGRDVDVIVAQHHSFHFTSAAAVVAGKLLKKPVVVRSEDVMRPMGVRVSLILEVVGYLTEILGTKATVFTVVCSEQKSSLLGRLRIPPQKIRIHPNFAPKPPEPIENSCHNQETPPTIVFVGRMTKEYGLDLLLKAVPMVIASHPEAQVVLIGDGPEGPYLKALATSLGIGNNVWFAGVRNQKQISHFLERATVGIGPLLPTRTLPRKVIEYSLSSIPMVLGENSVTSDFAHPSENCVVVSPVPSRIAEAVVNFINDFEFRSRIGITAHETAMEFELEKACSSFQKLLEETRTGSLERLG